MIVFVVIEEYDTGCCSQTFIKSIRTTKDEANEDIKYLQNKNKFGYFEIKQIETEENLKDKEC